MNRRDVVLAIFVAFLWGINFVAIHQSLEHYPPMFLVALRFAVLALPTLLFVPRPQVPVKWLLTYGIGFGVVQFGFMYWGMTLGMPAGLTSLVLQASAPFTVLLAATLLKEKLSLVQLIGIAVAIVGLGVIGWYRGMTVSVLPVILVLIGALGWAVGNIGSRLSQPESPFRLMMWMTVIPPLPMLMLSLIVEGPGEIWQSLATAFSPDALNANLGLAYTVLLGTVVGTGIWTALLKRNSSSRVAPFSMLVPVFGFTSAWLLLGEMPALAEILGGALVIFGVLLPTLRPKPGTAQYR